jgi:hypothetical protein
MTAITWTMAQMHVMMVSLTLFEQTLTYIFIAIPNGKIGPNRAKDK